MNKRNKLKTTHLAKTRTRGSQTTSYCVEALKGSNMNLEGVSFDKSQQFVTETWDERLGYRRVKIAKLIFAKLWISQRDATFSLRALVYPYSDCSGSQMRLRTLEMKDTIDRTNSQIVTRKHESLSMSLAKGGGETMQHLTEKSEKYPCALAEYGAITAL